MSENNVYTSHHAKKTMGETEMIPRVSEQPVHEIRTHRPSLPPTKKGLSIGAKIMIAIAAFCIGAVGIVGGVEFFGGSTSQGASAVSKVANVVAPDSGVEACKQVSANMNKKSSNSSDNKPWTEAEFNKNNDPFKNSRYADIKVAGTRVMTFVYNESKTISAMSEDDQLGEAMKVMMYLPQYWGQLQVACANHGVTVADLPTN